MLVRLLRCLLENAHKHTRGRTDAAVQVVQLPDGAVFVRDNGVGFDPPYADKLFRSFEHLHSVGEFEGLGVALARKLVERHGAAAAPRRNPSSAAARCSVSC